MSEQKGHDPKTPQTGLSGRESEFDRRLREYRNTGGFAKPQRKTLQFINNQSSEFDTPSMDSKLLPKTTADEEFTETERLAFIDESTGLFNSRTIMGKIATEMRRSARYKHSFSIFVVELDGFNNIDHMTPLAVDLIFSSFCRLLSKNTREVDVLGRFDRSSLLLICPETNMNEAVIEAERLRHLVAATHFKQVGHHTGMTVSIGIATFPEHGNAAVVMLGAAMEAAQQAVAAGGNTICSAIFEASAESQKIAIPEEDFSPSDKESSQKAEELAEDMSPAADKASTDLAFPTPGVSSIIS